MNSTTFTPNNNLEILSKVTTACERMGIEPTEAIITIKAPVADIDADTLGRYSPGSETSHQAARDNLPRSGTQRRKVLEAIYEKPRTRDELSADLNLPDSAVDGRVLELRDEYGLVYDTTETRLTRNGSKAKVVACTPQGKKRLGG